MKTFNRAEFDLHQKLAPFRTEYKTEEDCMEELVNRVLAESGRRCRHCGSDKLTHQYGSRFVQCDGCRKTYSALAGTFFDGIRAARHHLAAIWLHENGVNFNAHLYHKVIGIASSSAQAICLKLMFIFQQYANAAQEPSASFVPIWCKRSSCTPANQHPIMEEDAFSEDGVDFVPFESTEQEPNGKDCHPGASMEQDEQQCEWSVDESAERKILELLAEGELCFDVLADRCALSISLLQATLTTLELKQIIVRLPGNYYKMREKKAAAKTERKRSSQNVKPIIQFVLANHHGISRKYLQLYVAAHYCYVDRERWKKGTVVRACVAYGPLYYRQVRAYCTPATVRLAARQCGPPPGANGPYKLPLVA